MSEKKKRVIDVCGHVNIVKDVYLDDWSDEVLITVELVYPRKEGQEVVSMLIDDVLCPNCGRKVEG